MALLKGIGKQLQIGVSKELTRGTTPASASYWLITDDWNVDEKFANAIDVSTYGVIEDSVGETRVKDWAEGQISMPLTGTTAAVLFLSLMGTDTPATHAGETVVYDHVMTVAQTVQHQSLSFYVHDPIPTPVAYGTGNSGATADYSHANAIVHKLDIDYSLGKFVNCSAQIMAKRGSSAAVAFSPSATPDSRYVPQYLTFKATTTATLLATTNAIKLKSAKISFDEKAESDDVLGSTAPRDFVNKEFSVTGTIEAIWQNEADFKSYTLTGSPRAVRFDLINTDVTLGVGTNPEFKIDLAKVTFEEISRPVKIKDIVYQTLKFKAHYSSGDGYMAKVTATNTVSAY